MYFFYMHVKFPITSTYKKHCSKHKNQNEKNMKFDNDSSKFYSSNSYKH